MRCLRRAPPHAQTIGLIAEYPNPIATENCIRRPHQSTSAKGRYFAISALSSAKSTSSIITTNKNRHRDRADIDDDQQHGDKFGTQQHKQPRRTEKRRINQSTECTGLRLITVNKPPAKAAYGKQIKANPSHSCRLVPPRVVLQHLLCHFHCAGHGRHAGKYRHHCNRFYFLLLGPASMQRAHRQPQRRLGLRALHSQPRQGQQQTALGRQPVLVARIAKGQFHHLFWHLRDNRFKLL